MNNPFLNTIRLRTLYLSIWMFITIIQLFVFQRFTYSYSDIIIYDSIITGALQSVCILLLWYPVRYSRGSFHLSLFLLFHLFLALLLLAVYLGLGYLFTKACVKDTQYYTDFFTQILLIRVFIGLLIYIIFVLVYYLFIANDERIEQHRKLAELEVKTQPIPEEKLTRISVKKRNSIHLIPVDQIYYIEANGDYVFIHTEKERYIKDRTMKYWETHLPEELFVRIHRSFIVNVEYIERVELYEKETYRVYLKNEEALRASAGGYKKLKIKN